MVGHRQRLGIPLRLVVYTSRPDRVHVAPVRLRLGVDLGVAVDLARRGEKEPRPFPLRQPERVMRAVRARLQRVERQPQVVDRACERCEVVDEVDRLVDRDRMADVVVEEREVVAEVLDVRQRARLEVVETDDPMTSLEERLAQVGAEETGAAGHERGRHRARCYPASRTGGPVLTKSSRGRASAVELDDLVADRDRSVAQDVRVESGAVDEVIDDPRTGHLLEMEAGLAELDAVALDRSRRETACRRGR